MCFSAFVTGRSQLRLTPPRFCDPQAKAPAIARRRSWRSGCPNKFELHCKPVNIRRCLVRGGSLLSHAFRPPF